MCQNLGWLVNLEKSELDPKQVFDFVGYQFDLQSGSLKRTHSKRHLVTSRKQAAHKLSGTKAVFLALKEFQDLCNF